MAEPLDLEADAPSGPDEVERLVLRHWEVFREVGHTMTLTGIRQLALAHLDELREGNVEPVREAIARLTGGDYS